MLLLEFDKLTEARKVLVVGFKTPKIPFQFTKRGQNLNLTSDLNPQPKHCLWLYFSLFRESDQNIPIRGGGKRWFPLPSRILNSIFGGVVLVGVSKRQPSLNFHVSNGMWYSSYLSCQSQKNFYNFALMLGKVFQILSEAQIMSALSANLYFILKK